MRIIDFLKKIIYGPHAVKHLLVGLSICLITLFAYRGVGDHGFSEFDDGFYVAENEQVQKGLTWENLLWAFSFAPTEEESYWLPLTWLSHMADCELFGLNPGFHHLTNLLLHILCALLLYLVFYKMTGAIWKSAALSLVFAVHPLNVDSVAWIAERKNLLSSLFWMLTLLAYVSYAKRPGPAR
jgi:protein O-mannosyl-transferase